MIRIPVVSLIAIALTACASGGMSKSDANTAHAMLQARSGSQVGGTLQLRPMGDGVHVSGTISGLAPNSDHGFHIHEKGDCSASDATSAGGHFNPTTQPHGKVGASPHHLGDQMNLHADANGNAMVDAYFAGVSLGSGQPNDVMNRALVVHADPDDYTSQPAGNAGKRIACGVIKQ
ncbi:superoxide dismutase family protein [Solilutibacter silvestris]|uniref:Superoxide dismutase [Cu-Zn] n=1 Tax=Solilutibacter silvestris TaxID=1645665 RepID=A0A2K1Q0V8_9GAMM|nr:Cu/Zn superoxide dismutase [Lysobacter silvestris]